MVCSNFFRPICLITVFMVLDNKKQKCNERKEEKTLQTLWTYTLDANDEKNTPLHYLTRNDDFFGNWQ